MPEIKVNNENEEEIKKCTGCGEPIVNAPHVEKVWAPIGVRQCWHTRCFLEKHSRLGRMPSAIR